MNPAKALLLLHSARHTPVVQLFHRIRLELKRKFLVALHRTPLRPGRPSASVGEVKPHSELPRPVFPPRMPLVARTEMGWDAVLLNKRTALRTPMTWLPRSPQLDLVTLHYMEYLEGVDDETFTDLVRDWIAQNPPYRPGYANHHWNSYALSLRCLVWMQQFAVRPPVAWQHGDILASLWEQLEFLSSNLEIDIRGNHLLKNIKTLLWGSRFFKGTARWEACALRLLERELGAQFTADGFHFEASPGYHLQVFADMLECHSLLVASPLKERLGAILDGMAQVAVDLRHPDGFTSLLGDSGFHMAYSPDACLAAYRDQRGHEVQARAAFSFSDAGIFGYRDPSMLLVLDCGRVGPDVLPAHGHGDILSFELSAFGKRVVVDTGVFEYQEGPRRARSRSTAAHNTVTLDDADQAQFWKSFRVGRRPKVRVDRVDLGTDRFHLEGRHDGYSGMPGSPCHVRHFDVAPGRLRVVDRIQGGCGQKATSRLLLNGEVPIKEVPGGLDIEVAGRVLRLRSDTPMSCHKTVWWPDFGCERPAIQVVMDLGPTPAEGAFELTIGDLPQL